MNVFYGWKIVAASIIILAVGLGMFFSTNSLFVIPVSEAFDVSRGEFTFHRTIITLVGAASMAFYGKAVQRFGVRKILLTGSVMLGLITIGYSFAQNLWHFYVLAFVHGIFFHALGFMVIGILVSDWFTDKKGFATGMAFAGSGLGGAIMIPIVSQVMQITDWRFAFRFMGVLGIAILVPVIYFMVKEKPEMLGLKPYILPEKDEEAKAAKAPLASLSFKEARRTSRFWLLLAAFLSISSFAAATNTHTAPFLTDLGYPVATVSAMVSLFMIALTGGKILLGWIYDRFGVMAGHGVIIVCCFIFPVAALFSHIPALPWVYALTMGMASCGVSVPVSILIIRNFGQKDFPVIFSFFTMIATLGAAVSVPTMGIVHDNTGSYDLAWFAFLGFAVVILVCLVGSELLYRRKHND